MNDVQALERELVGLAKEREIAVTRGDTGKAGFIDDVIANRRWRLKRLQVERDAKAKES